MFRLLTLSFLMCLSVENAYGYFYNYNSDSYETPNKRYKSRNSNISNTSSNKNEKDIFSKNKNKVKEEDNYILEGKNYNRVNGDIYVSDGELCQRVNDTFICN